MDRRILVFLVLFILVFEFKYIYLPNKKKLDNLTKLVSKKEEEYREFINLCEEYKKTGENKENQGFKVASQKFSFFSYLNDLIDKTGIKTNVNDIKILPREEIEKYVLEKIEVELNLISLEQLLSLLSQIEKTNGIYIYKYEMKRDKNKPYLLNVSIGLTCLKKKYNF
jgi:hypothetical protein